MNFARLEKTDAKRWLELWNRAATHDPMTRDLLNEKIWADPDYQPAMAVAAVDQQRPLGFGVAVVRSGVAPLRGYIKLLAVDPGVQRQGVGLQLCRQLQDVCRRAGATEMRVGESAPNYLTPGVDRRYRAACGLFEREAYTAFDEACNMRLDLSEWERQRSSERQSQFRADSCRIARATIDLARPLQEFITAYWPSWWAEVSSAMSNEPCTLFVAIEGDKIVGFAAHEANNRGIGWFGPMGTSPEARGRGLGRKLLDACLEDMLRSGYRYATIPWVGPVDFYRKLTGAEIDRRFIRFARSLAQDAP